MKIVIEIFLVAVSNILAIYDEEWTKFKNDYEKSYGDSEQETYRHNIFKNNVKDITDHNKNYKKGLVTYTKRLNRYGDVTAEEFHELYTHNLPVDDLIKYNDTVQSTSDDRKNGDGLNFLDWRQKGFVTSVKDQGSCGSCYIFSSIGVLEAYHFKEHGKLVSLSAQNMVDCIGNDTCMGGWPSDVLSFVEQHGISTEENYPYKGREGTCKERYVEKINFTFSSIIDTQYNETMLKDDLDHFGPISVCLYMHSQWMFYDSGVWYEDECSDDLNHAVLVVGYGTENGQDYWLIKNSIGADWGDEGYMKFARNKHQNYCGLTNAVFYVV